jgi:hypothetical protein
VRSRTNITCCAHLDTSVSSRHFAVADCVSALTAVRAHPCSHTHTCMQSLQISLPSITWHHTIFNLVRALTSPSSHNVQTQNDTFANLATSQTHWLWTRTSCMTCFVAKTKSSCQVSNARKHKARTKVDTQACTSQSSARSCHIVDTRPSTRCVRAPPRRARRAQHAVPTCSSSDAVPAPPRCACRIARQYRVARSRHTRDERLVVVWQPVRRRLARVHFSPTASTQTCLRSPVLRVQKASRQVQKGEDTALSYDRSELLASPPNCKCTLVSEIAKGYKNAAPVRALKRHQQRRYVCCWRNTLWCCRRRRCWRAGANCRARVDRGLSTDKCGRLRRSRWL